MSAVEDEIGDLFGGLKELRANEYNGLVSTTNLEINELGGGVACAHSFISKFVVLLNNFTNLTNQEKPP